MNWVNVLSPWQWAVLLSIPPLIVLLYFLKLRRSPVLVPSTYLWRRTIEDLQVNHFWQRLRRNLLLLLQLLFVAMLILACLRPGFTAQQQSGARRIFLLDTSASMQATDAQPSRFEAAKRLIDEQIDAMGEDDVAMLIAFSNRADVRQGFTSDRSRLRAALRATEVTNRTSDIGEALRAAAGLANPGRRSFDDQTDLQVAEAKPADLLVYSDGRFPPVNEFDLSGLTPTYVPVGSPQTENLGIVAFAVDRNETQRTDDASIDAAAAQAYARVRNASPKEVTATVSLTAADELLDAAELIVPAGEERGVSFALPQIQVATGYRLQLDRGGALAVDDVATATVRPDRRAEVLLVSDGTRSLETVLRLPSIAEVSHLTAIDSQRYKAWEAESFARAPGLETAFDLIVFDGIELTQLPPANTLMIGGHTPAESGWKWDDAETNSLIVDWDRSHPITQYLTLGNLLIASSQAIHGPEGQRVLVRGDNGPLVVTAPRGAFVDVVVGFPLQMQVDGQSIPNTDWPIRRSFPLFIYGVLQYAGGAARQQENLSIRPGEAALLSLPPRIDDFVIQTPDGERHPARRDSLGQVVWTQTDQIGLYRVAAASAPDTTLDVFCVNLASAAETDIATATDVQFGYQNIAASESTRNDRRELWRWVLLLGLGILVAEWAVFSRRVLA